MTHATWKSRLRRRLADGPLRHLAEPVFRGAVAAELSALRYLDARWPHEATPASFLTSVTAIVKTFERPRLLERLIASLKLHFPALSIIVADDSRRPTELPGVRTLCLDYDVGVSAGRQAALAQVQSELTWVLDDDFIVYRGTLLARVVRTLREQPELDLVGGRVIDLPLGTARGSPKDNVYPTDRLPLVALGTRLGAAVVCDKVPNFFVARTERLRRVGWDARLKRVEHGDFFTRARGVLVTGFDEQFSCLHAQTPFDSAYMSKREDYAADEALLLARHFPGSVKAC